MYKPSYNLVVFPFLFLPGSKQIRPTNVFFFAFRELYLQLIYTEFKGHDAVVKIPVYVP